MAEFRINVVVDPRQAEAGAGRVRGALDRTSDSSERLRNTLRRAFTTAAVIAAITGLVSSLSTFEQSMSTARAITGATEAQFAALREEATRLGSTTRFTATQAGEGIIFLARAGFNADQILGTLEGTLRLAQAGALDLGTAADIASNILQAFRLEVDQTNRVIDVMALIANSSNTNIIQLGEGMKLVAPVAAGLGVSVEETSAAIGVLSNAGLQSTLAGTGLRRVLSELVSPSTSTRRIMEQLGLATHEYNVQTIGLTQTLMNSSSRQHRYGAVAGDIRSAWWAGVRGIDQFDSRPR